MDYRIFIVCMCSFLCVPIHMGVGHTDRESAQHFWLRKPHKCFLCSWRDSNSGHWCHRILSPMLYQLSNPCYPAAWQEDRLEGGGPTHNCYPAVWEEDQLESLGACSYSHLLSHGMRGQFFEKIRECVINNTIQQCAELSITLFSSVQNRSLAQGMRCVITYTCYPVAWEEDQTQSWGMYSISPYRLESQPAGWSCDPACEVWSSSCCDCLNCDHPLGHLQWWSSQHLDGQWTLLPWGMHSEDRGKHKCSIYSGGIL